MRIISRLTGFCLMAVGLIGWVSPAGAVERVEAIKAIIGESASEPGCMDWIAGAIQARGTLRGVYGVNNPYVQRATGRDWQRAGRAWENPKPTTANHWLTPGEHSKPTAQWYRHCREVGRCGSHVYYDCPWRS